MNHTQPNDPASSEQAYCRGHGETNCDKRLDENTATRSSAEQGQCKQCYELEISDNPKLLDRNFKAIKKSSEMTMLFVSEYRTTIFEAIAETKQHNKVVEENL